MLAFTAKTYYSGTKTLLIYLLVSSVFWSVLYVLNLSLVNAYNAHVIQNFCSKGNLGTRKTNIYCSYKDAVSYLKVMRLFQFARSNIKPWIDLRRISTILTTNVVFLLALWACIFWCYNFWYSTNCCCYLSIPTLFST